MTRITLILLIIREIVVKNKLLRKLNEIINKNA